MRSNYLIGIRGKFFCIFFFSLFVGFFIALYINGIARDKNTDYSQEVKRFNYKSDYLFQEISKNKKDYNKIQDIIEKNAGYIDIFLVNNEGNIILKPRNNYEKQIDIESLLKSDTRTNFKEKQVRYYIVKMLDKNEYVVISNILVKGDEMKYFILGLIIFVVLFLVLTYSRIKYIYSLSEGLMEISKGNLNYRVNIKGKDELSLLGENINYMTEQLEDIKTREKKIEKNKNELIANVSHDLRTPLTSIVGYIKLLKDQYSYKDDIRKYINIIDNKAQRLDDLVNSLFEYTTLTSFDIKLEVCKVSINEFMRQIVEGMMPICTEKDLNICVQLPEDEIIVKIDTSKMFRVFENIIINAVRYSDKFTTINIKVSKEIEGIIVSIENEGIAIRKDDLSKAFSRFYRSDKARASNTGGSGLGLAIAKSIVELHSGKIWAQNKENKVTFFVLIK